MAFVPETVFAVTFTFRDNNGNTANTSVYLPGTLPFADVTAAATLLANAMVPVSDAYLSDIFISYTLRNDAAANPPATSEVERKLVFSLDTAQYPGVSTVSVPSPLFALEQPRTDVPDPNNAALQVLIAALQSGGLGSGNGITTYYGADITTASKIVIKHRNRKPRT